jgi:hypothetical protein
MRELAQRYKQSTIKKYLDQGEACDETIQLEAADRNVGQKSQLDSFNLAGELHTGQEYGPLGSGSRKDRLRSTGSLVGESSWKPK